MKAQLVHHMVKTGKNLQWVFGLLKEGKQQKLVQAAQENLANQTILGLNESIQLVSKSPARPQRPSSGFEIKSPLRSKQSPSSNGSGIRVREERKGDSPSPRRDRHLRTS